MHYIIQAEFDMTLIQKRMAKSRAIIQSDSPIARARLSICFQTPTDGLKVRKTRDYVDVLRMSQLAGSQILPNVLVRTVKHPGAR